MMRGVIRHIAKADLLVLPSYTEGAPMVVLEAMACGRAILATSVGAVPEMFDIGGPEECGVCIARHRGPAPGHRPVTWRSRLPAAFGRNGAATGRTDVLIVRRSG